MTSQLVIFRAFLFIFFSSPPPDPWSEKKNPVNQLKKYLALGYDTVITFPYALIQRNKYSSCP